MMHKTRFLTQFCKSIRFLPGGKLDRSRSLHFTSSQRQQADDQGGGDTATAAKPAVINVKQALSNRPVEGKLFRINVMYL